MNMPASVEILVESPSCTRDGNGTETGASPAQICRAEDIFAPNVCSEP